MYLKINENFNITLSEIESTKRNENNNYSRLREKFLFLLSIFLTRSRVSSMPGSPLTRDSPSECPQLRECPLWRCLAASASASASRPSSTRRVPTLKVHCRKIQGCNGLKSQIWCPAKIKVFLFSYIKFFKKHLMPWYCWIDYTVLSQIIVPLITTRWHYALPRLFCSPKQWIYFCCQSSRHRGQYLQLNVNHVQIYFPLFQQEFTTGCHISSNKQLV